MVPAKLRTLTPSLSQREREYNPRVTRYLDLETWPRRDLFEFYRHFDKPYFNVCTRLDVTNLLSALSARKDISVSLAYHYFALRTANEIEPFRYRLRDGKVVVHEVIHGGTTVLLPNESFGLAYRSEEHTSELQSQSNLVCRLLLEKKNTNNIIII